MLICNLGHEEIVYNSYKGCPICRGLKKLEQLWNNEEGLDDILDFSYIKEQFTNG